MRTRLTTWLVGACVGAVLAAAAPAAADTVDDQYELLYQATVATAAAARTGVDVVQTVRYGSATDLSGEVPQVGVSVPGGTRLRTHSTVNADGSSYLSVRYQPTGRLLAATGVDPGSMTPWATVRMLDRSARTQARAAGVPDRTALTGVPVRGLLDPRIVESPVSVALRLLVPPYSGSLDEGWTAIDVLPQPDGTTVIRGAISRAAASDGEDLCTRPLVEVTVGSDSVIRESRWTQKCPGEGVRTYRAVAVYGPQVVQGPTRPRLAAADVLR